jgi:hypothetical protein
MRNNRVARPALRSLADSVCRASSSVRANGKYSHDDAGTSRKLLRSKYQQGIHEWIAPSHFPGEIASALTTAERTKVIRRRAAPPLIRDILTTPPVLYNANLSPASGSQIRKTGLFQYCERSGWQKTATGGKIEVEGNGFMQDSCQQRWMSPFLHPGCHPSWCPQSSFGSEPLAPFSDSSSQKNPEWCPSHFPVAAFHAPVHNRHLPVSAWIAGSTC